MGVKSWVRCASTDHRGSFSSFFPRNHLLDALLRVVDQHVEVVVHPVVAGQARGMLVKIPGARAARIAGKVREGVAAKQMMPLTSLGYSVPLQSLGVF